MHIVQFDLPAGIKVFDGITGTMGIITSRVERLNGCRQYYVQPKNKEDGTPQDGQYLDYDRLVVSPALETGALKQLNQPTSFKFNTGDRVKNRVNGLVGIVTVLRVDLNGCQGCWFETGAMHEGRMLEFYAFEQELELVDQGLNAPAEKPIERKATGCVAIAAPQK